MQPNRPLPDRGPPEPAARHYVLRLFITGATPRSQRAIRNLRAVCDEHLSQRYELEIIDIYQQPELARAGDVIAAPTLVKTCPPPVCRLIGDLSNRAQVLSRLSLGAEPRTAAAG